jgi:anhydro-N-acetylmuramic acid kinase
VQFDPLRVVAARTFPFPEACRALCLALGQGQSAVELDALGQLDIALGAAFADAANQLIGQIGLARNQIRAIGSHGQTVRHRPQLPHPFTLQLGCPHVIAERTGICTVADFRRRDVAAGGQGAPLVPAFHAAVFGQTGACVLNLGGIANISVLQGKVLGFDTGPANALLDAYAQRHFGVSHDLGGAIAATGTVVRVLLSRLLADPYFAADPPKSTGREYFNLAWLAQQAGDLIGTLAPADVLATLAQLTAHSVADETRNYQPTELWVCGGGVHNADLMHRVQQLHSCPVRSTAAFGLDPDFVEAACFAWLARESLAARPGNLAAVTGARGARILGAVVPG